MPAKCTRTGNGCRTKRRTISAATQAKRIIEAVRRRRDHGRQTTLSDFWPTPAIWQEIQRQLSPAEWVDLNY